MLPTINIEANENLLFKVKRQLSWLNIWKMCTLTDLYDEYLIGITRSFSLRTLVENI